MKEVQVNINGESQLVPFGTTLWELSIPYQEGDAAIVLARVDEQLSELYKKVHNSCNISFVTTSDSAGHLAYKRSMTLLLLRAVYDCLGQKASNHLFVRYSISKGYYCEFELQNISLSLETLTRIKERMKEIVVEDMVIVKTSISTDKASKKFREYGMYDKENLFRYRRSSKTNLYQIGNFEDYFYGYMVPSTGYLKYFDLFLYEDGFVLQMPDLHEPNIVPPFVPQEKLFKVLKESKTWSQTMELETVGHLNDEIANGKINDLILVQEALQEKKIAQLADEIIRQNKKIVLIAGPSSSGKTTFSHRLAIQLRVQGFRPHPISIDDYFLNRVDSPRDENGDFNFEVIECIDIDLFQQDMMNLLNREEVKLPTYNFVLGKREYKKKVKQLGDNDILVIEGIHGLNQKMTTSLPRESIFKIYISALTQLNVDEHNRIPTTDGRLLRRIVRDARHRGTSAKDTIGRWESVRRGENENIFPFQEEADAMFNSALIYELAVLKQYAEPLLFAIDKDCPEYEEAKRLLKFLDYFLGIPNYNIPLNSLIREFIGGSCFDV